MALISLDHVSKIYPRGTRPALDDVNLHIDRGDFVFLVGASGSGKTTLLSLLLREEEATDGEIHVAGNDLRRLTNRQVPQYRRSIGFIFQDYKLLNNKTVWQNVAFALEVIGTRRSTIKSLVPKVLETVGLTGKENSYPHELSGGEQQRVTIARAYVNHPQILLADEPTGNLDPTTSLGIMEVLDAINRTGTTIVMATHNEEIVNSMRKRVVELHAGKIVRDERQGSYDSALYFPDAEVESRSQQALGMGGDARFRPGAAGADAATTGSIAAVSGAGVADVAGVAGADANVAHDDNVAQNASAGSMPAEGRGGAHSRRNSRARQAERVIDQVTEAINGDQTDEGIARLANSVHSGRTGRYGEVFAPVETTLTWGRGLKLDEYEASLKAGESASSDAADEAGTIVPDAHAEPAETVAADDIAVAADDAADTAADASDTDVDRAAEPVAADAPDTAPAEDADEPHDDQPAERNDRPAAHDAQSHEQSTEQRGKRPDELMPIDARTDRRAAYAAASSVTAMPKLPSIPDSLLMPAAPQQPAPSQSADHADAQSATQPTGEFHVKQSVEHQPDASHQPNQTQQQLLAPPMPPAPPTQPSAHQHQFDRANRNNKEDEETR